jgi:hypothetical protein
MNDDLMKVCKEILTGRRIDSLICPQCDSEGCGPYRCRFSGMTHELWRINRYAETKIEQDQETPKWERDLKTGAGNG